MDLSPSVAIFVGYMAWLVGIVASRSVIDAWFTAGKARWLRVQWGLRAHVVGAVPALAGAGVELSGDRHADVVGIFLAAAACSGAFAWWNWPRRTA